MNAQERLIVAIQQTELKSSQHNSAVDDQLIEDKYGRTSEYIRGEIHGLRHALAILVGEKEATRMLEENNE